MPTTRQRLDAPIRFPGLKRLGDLPHPPGTLQRRQCRRGDRRADRITAWATGWVHKSPAEDVELTRTNSGKVGRRAHPGGESQVHGRHQIRQSWSLHASELLWMGNAAAAVDNCRKLRRLIDRASTLIALDVALLRAFQSPKFGPAIVFLRVRAAPWAQSFRVGSRRWYRDGLPGRTPQ
jgi:hypothetical protein